MTDIEHFNLYFAHLEDAINYVREKVANGTKIAGWTDRKGGKFRSPAMQGGLEPLIIVFEDGELVDLSVAMPWGRKLPTWKGKSSYAIIAQNEHAFYRFHTETFHNPLPEESGSYYIQDETLIRYDEENESDEFLVRFLDCSLFRVYNFRKDEGATN